MNAAKSRRAPDLESRRGADRSETALSVDGLEKRYGEGAGSVQAVDGVSFSVDPGEIVGLLGPNGAGKTTTLKSILGLVEPDAGRVAVAGVDVRADPRRAYRLVGATFEGARNVYWKLTVRENLRFFATLRGNDPDALADRHERLLDRFDLADRADAPVNELSMGMKQKVSIACTLARDVDLVVLDEPTLGLDVESSIDLRAELRRLATDDGVTVLLSSHDMAVVEDVCDRVVVIDDGRVIADDSVDAITDRLRSREYRVTLDGQISDALGERLASEYGATVGAGERTTVTTALDDASFYEFVATLSESNVPVADVATVEPDLEDAFVELTEGGASDGE